MQENTIIGAEDADPADLNPYHRNPRRGDVDAIAASIQSLGQYKPIVVNRGTLTGRPNEVLAGNHTHQAAQQLGHSSIKVVWVDVDDTTAAKIVVGDNRTGDLATYDSAMLFDLLDSISTLDGTGFAREDYDSILADLTPAPGKTDHAATPKQPGKTQEGGSTFSRHDDYQASETRGILMDYNLDDYDHVQEQLADLRERHGAEDSAELVLRLVEAATGETAPAEEAAA